MRKVRKARKRYSDVFDWSGCVCFELHAPLRMMLFLVRTFVLVFSTCAYDNIRYGVTPRYTGRFQLNLSCLPHSRFGRFATLSDSRGVGPWCSTPTRADVSVFPIGAKSVLCLLTASSSEYARL